MQYLERYAEAEARAIPRLSTSFEHVVVIPAMGERESLLDTLDTVPDGPTLAIVVLNARRDAADWVHNNNAAVRALMTRTYGAGTTLGKGAPMMLRPTRFGALLCIDRAVDPWWLPEKQGVGLARKIGADVALALIQEGSVTSSWIHMTDADVQLPADYFLQTTALQKPAAFVYAFSHRPRPCPLLGEAMHLYEMSLRYYVLGLRYAGSPYAFHTVGSTIAMDAKAYAAVRGVPLRDAAEDFYLLDKLRKVGPVQSLHGAPLRIDGRISQRVPFGTGRALWKLTTTEDDAPFQLYDPQSFAYLRAWLSILAQPPEGADALRDACHDAPVQDGGLLHDTVTGLGAVKALHIAHTQTSSAAARQRSLTTWFDAFRTLKFIHTLRDRELPMIPWEDALRGAAFIEPSAAAEPLPSLCARLASLERASLNK